MEKRNDLTISSLIDMGIDLEKAKFIQFLVENERLDIFFENEHFYYWAFKKEIKLSDFYGFIKSDQQQLYELHGKKYDLNSFDGISELVVEVTDAAIIDKIFCGTAKNSYSLPNFQKEEYFLRYSKKFKTLEYYKCEHGLGMNRKRDKVFVNHNRLSIFKINENNYVKIYPNKRMCRYISNKSVLYFGGGYGWYNNSSEETLHLKINRRLLNIHLRSSLYDSDESFAEVNSALNYLPNKALKGCDSLEDLLNRMTNYRPVPKILRSKFSLPEIINLYNIVKYEEVDKIIKFLYDYHDFFEECTARQITQILCAYIGVRLGVMVADKKSRAFVSVDEKGEPKETGDFVHPFGWVPFPHSVEGEIRDYIVMCRMNDKKVNLKFKSIKRLKEEHDEMSRLIKAAQIPQIKVKRGYPKIKSEMSFFIERIEDRNRLLAESEMQQHCVKTYAASINKGLCCIYSFLDEEDGRRYTLEVRRHKNNQLKMQVFILNQIRGKFNVLPEPKIMKRVVSILSNYGIMPDMKEAISKGFVPENKNSLQNVNHNIHLANNHVQDDDILPF